MSKPDHSDMIFEVTGPEGCDFSDLKINRWGFGRELVRYYGQMDKRKNKDVSLIVKVVGLRDRRAPKRNWGLLAKDKQP